MNKTQLQISRRQLLQTSTALLGLSATGMVLAQEKFPSHPVRIIVPLPAGGVADAATRWLTQTMQPTFGQPLIVDNKPGGSFVVGMGALSSAPADGYTVIHVNSAFLSAQALFSKFDVFKQLVPIAGLGETDETMCMSQNPNFKNAKELIAYGRANPGKLSYVTPGYGTLEHLAAYNFCKLNGINAVAIPMKGGPDAARALIQGEGDFGVVPLPLISQFANTGKLIPLFVLNTKRNPTLPDLPTYDEAGVKATRCTIWGGLCAPAGTPAVALAYLQKTVLEAAGNPVLQRKMVGAGMVPAAMAPEVFAKMMHDDYEWIAKAIKDADIKIS